MEKLTFVQIEKGNEKHCEIFKKLMLPYSIELEMKYQDTPIASSFLAKWIASIIDMQETHDRYLELAFLDDEAIGFLYGKIDHKEHKGFIKPEYGYIMEFYVKPEYRQSGYGRAMFYKMAHLFLSNGVKQMYLTTNTDVGRMFWEALGFVQTGEVSPDNGMEIYECYILTVKEITTKGNKSTICNYILNALPSWFGVPESVIDYAQKVADMPFYACYCGGVIVGFLAIKMHTTDTAEICVMGVLQEYHRMGIGRKLLSECIKYCKQQGCRFLTVKTLADLNPDDGYAKTRAFYLSCGFRPLEVFHQIWDERNPCLFLAMAITPPTIRHICKNDVIFLCELMNKPEIMATLHTNETNISHWQDFFTASPSDNDEENFIVYQDYMPCAWLKINGLMNKDTAWLSMLVVSDKHHRQGIGSFTVSYAEDFIKAKGFSKIGIPTTEDNIAAQALYKKCGYVITEYGNCTTGDGVARKGYTFVKILQSNIEYKTLLIDDLSPDMLTHFSRYQEVSKYYSKTDLGLTLADCNFTEQWDEDKKQTVINEDFREVLQYGGAIFAACDSGKLIGFGCYDGRFIESEHQYLQLICLHVSCEYRHKGIGRSLFNLCADNARKAGAKKLYISANSSYDTQRFYRAIGCIEAVEEVKHLCDKEPYDIQMEYVL